jgi:Zn-dependent protease with chaperone function
MTCFKDSRRRAVAALLIAFLTLSGPAAGQTKVTPPKNKYTPEQDAQIGREAAAEVRQQYPIIRDAAISGYLDQLGRRLVQVAPRELDHPVFEYSFTPVNLKEINAFALPGGPMFVFRGMLEAAETEGEVAGVMAHELSHILLRHGTANATKAQGFQLGALAGAIAGAVIGGGWGTVISQGSQFGLGTWLLKYSREYEKQADLLGVQLMARAGYDPRDLSRMFETIQRSSGRGGPEWMSSHPNPGNRSTYIAQEAARVQVAARPPSNEAFERAKARFGSLPPARSAAEIERTRRDDDDGASGSVGTPGRPVPAPSGQYRVVRGGQLFEARVPANWRELASNSAIKYVPQNGYGQVRGETVFTHGVEMGVARASSRNLRDATVSLVGSFAAGNPELRSSGDQRSVRISGRNAILTPLINSSALGGRERIDLYTTFLSDGSLFYYLGVVPEGEARTYGPVFGRIAQSIALRDR